MRGNPTQRARDLRRNQTDAEALLWRYLKAKRLHECKFRRQHPIGPYFVDFACPGKRLVVELDGGQHSERARYDLDRTQYLERSGWRVLRFWNDEMLRETDAVLERIFAELNAAPLPGPLPASGAREQGAAPLPGPLPANGARE
jgi:adenine-specific DNA-methyltransferase